MIGGTLSAVALADCAQLFICFPLPAAAAVAASRVEMNWSGLWLDLRLGCGGQAVAGWAGRRVADSKGR